jgi:hypothetical protein
MTSINDIPVWKLSQVIGITNAPINQIEKSSDCTYREIEYPPIYSLPGIERYFEIEHFEKIKINEQEPFSLTYYVPNKLSSPLVIEIKELQPLKILIGATEVVSQNI